jgi:multiple sugar transport system substrate-binding protein
LSAPVAFAEARTRPVEPGALNVALVGGPAYDALYELLPEFEAKTGKRVHVGARLPLPELYAHLDEVYRSGAGAYDLISTHSRYVPSQKPFLRPLDDWFRATELNEFIPARVEMSRAEGWLLSLPRNLEVRLLHLRRDLFDDPGEQAKFRQATGRELRPPESWEELAQVARHFTRSPELFGFAFPAREGGLFGTFAELTVMAGGNVFLPDLRPGFADSAGRWALGFLRRLYLEDRVTPSELPDMSGDEISELLLSGRCAMGTDRPGAFRRYQDPAHSRVAGRFDLALYPRGPAGARRVWAGEHAFAIPTSVHDEEGARALVKFLVSPDAQWLEAQQGALPVLKSVEARLKDETPADSVAGRRLALLEQAASDMLLPPRLAQYPEMEKAACACLLRGLTGEWSVDDALHRAAAEMEKILAG